MCVEGGGMWLVLAEGHKTMYIFVHVHAEYNCLCCHHVEPRYTKFTCTCMLNVKAFTRI